MKRLISYRIVFATLCASVAVLSIAATPAFAESPWWHIAQSVRPSTLPAAIKKGSELVPGKGQIALTVGNLGDANATAGSGNPIEIIDELPPGLTQTAIEAVPGVQSNPAHPTMKCSLGGGTVPPSCVVEGTVAPFESIEVRLDVSVETRKLGPLTNASRVEGGNVPATSLSRAVTIGSAPTVFGAQMMEMVPEEEGGAIDTQAGSHPFQFTTTLELNQTGGNFNPETGLVEAEPPALVKDLSFKLPPGFVGNPTVFPECTLEQFASGACPPNTALGVSSTVIDEPRAVGLLTITVPVFNLEPAVGEPARFGFRPTPETPIYLDTAVRTGEDYGVTVNVDNIVQVAGLLSSEVSLWGVPGDPRHDRERGNGCLRLARGATGEEDGLPAECNPINEKAPPPFLSMPTSCARPFEASVSGDSWDAQHEVLPLATYRLPLSLDGCNRMPFAPELRVAPDGTSASSPTGLSVDVHVPQDSVLIGNGLAESTVKRVTVALPEGVAINPSGGDGLAACSEGMIGYQGERELEPEHEPGARSQLFTSAFPNPFEQGINFCPDASKVGTVTVRTPLLPNPLIGSVYLAAQNENPFGSLVAMYLVARDPVSGVLVKLPGEVSLNQSTGRVEATFDSPELPFSDAELHFFGGERAPLASPAHCGLYETKATYVPWSGGEPVRAASTFAIDGGPKTQSQPNGGPCPGATLPFSPALTGGMLNNNGGAFSALSTTIEREDGQQNMQAVTMHMPPGLSGQLSSVALCGEPQADQGTCGPESQIGETTVSAGVGSDPVSVKGGRVYITGPYEGAPFGLSIVNPVKAGPFDLEHDTANPNQDPACDCIVVRAKVEVDPQTAALTVVTDESGPHSIPHLIDGIPVQIRKVNVLVNRPHFTFNPTNCAQAQITGAISSDGGASSPVSVPFDSANCATLKFEPKFEVFASGKTSKADGASLTARVSEPAGSLGTQSNLTKVKVELPLQLPSRLTTLQKACTAAQFNTNPAGCPPASFIGHAVVHTPLLPVPLEGPAIFVSHGGESFPSLTIVLQGDNVTIDLVGSTYISSKGVTSTTFKTVPDAPFSTFELTLPQGPFSALAANGNLCASTRTVTVSKRVTVEVHGHRRKVTRKVRESQPTSLIMPTELIAQNGAQIHQNTRVAVTGCAKAKPAKKAKNAKGARKAKKGRKG